MPVKKDNGTTILRCTKCGYEIQPRLTAYRIAKIGGSNRVQTTSVVTEGKKIGRKREELEQEKEEYYKELFLELLHEEEYGGEET